MEGQYGHLQRAISLGEGVRGAGQSQDGMGESTNQENDTQESKPGAAAWVANHCSNKAVIGYMAIPADL